MDGEVGERVYALPASGTRPIASSVRQKPVAYVPPANRSSMRS